MNQINEKPCEKLLANDNVYIIELYQSCYPDVENYVIKNKGSAQHAEDVFQESMLALFQKCVTGNFTLTSAICTFLFSIAKNHWLKELKRQKGYIRIEKDFDKPDDNNITENDMKEEEQRLFLRCLDSMDEKCQNIIHLYLDGMKGKEIATKLEYSSYKYYRVAKNRCLKKLKYLMRKNL